MMGSIVLAATDEGKTYFRTDFVYGPIDGLFNGGDAEAGEEGLGGFEVAVDLGSGAGEAGKAGESYVEDAAFHHVSGDAFFLAGFLGGFDALATEHIEGEVFVGEFQVGEFGGGHALGIVKQGFGGGDAPAIAEFVIHLLEVQLLGGAEGDRPGADADEAQGLAEIAVAGLLG